MLLWWMLKQRPERNRRNRLDFACFWQRVAFELTTQMLLTALLLIYVYGTHGTSFTIWTTKYCCGIDLNPLELPQYH